MSEDKADLHSELLEEFRSAREGRQWALEVGWLGAVGLVTVLGARLLHIEVPALAGRMVDGWHTM